MREEEIAEFVAEADKRLYAYREAQMEREVDQQIRIRDEWLNVLGLIRKQLPLVLRVSVNAEFDVLREEPVAGPTGMRGVSLCLPDCTPIVLDFGFGCWAIEHFWPQQAIGVLESDGKVELEIRTPTYVRDVYLAVAIAHENYWAWERWEREVSRRRNVLNEIELRTLERQSQELEDHKEENLAAKDNADKVLERMIALTDRCFLGRTEGK